MSAKEQVVFVFYTLQRPERWTYHRLPSGWRWVGAGFTEPVLSNAASTHVQRYQHEEQFMGPKMSRDIMKLYLQTYFDRLKEKGIVRIYKIRYAYRP